MNKKGFTLVEVIGVIIIIGLICLVIIPTFGGIMKKEKEKMYNQILSQLYTAAEDYINVEEISDEKIKVSIDTLLSDKYLESQPIDPRDKTELSGCVYVSYYNNNYNYNYYNSCTGASLKSRDDNLYIWDDLYSNKVKKISFIYEEELKKNREPFLICDLSLNNDWSIMGYLEVSDESGYYDAIIFSKIDIIATDLSNYFSDLRYVEEINFENFDSSRVENMYQMFYNTGYYSTKLSLNFGDNFNTSSAKNMQQMFASTGYSAQEFNLDLGDNFYTTNVTTMNDMYSRCGHESLTFTLDLGHHFNPKEVIDAHAAFYETGYKSEVFTLNLGPEFDLSKALDTSALFNRTGYNSKIFKLDLTNFKVSASKNMQYMFDGCAYNSPVFTLNMGSHFDTSNVTDMYKMFNATGYSNNSFTLDLGPLFNTSKVTNMEAMFKHCGYTSTEFDVDLTGFDTSSVTNMRDLFCYTGYSTPDLYFDLSSFNTSKVTNMIGMFYRQVNLNNIYVGSGWTTAAVTESNEMFDQCSNLVGGNGTVFSASYIDKTYARVDASGTPGYLTLK